MSYRNEQTYSFSNLVTNESGPGKFCPINNSFYEITAGELAGNRFMWDEFETDWVGDGMFVLVRQSSSLEIENYAGKYTFIDVDADFGNGGGFAIIPVPLL